MAKLAHHNIAGLKYPNIQYITILAKRKAYKKNFNELKIIFIHPPVHSGWSS